MFGLSVFLFLFLVRIYSTSGNPAISRSSRNNRPIIRPTGSPFSSSSSSTVVATTSVVVGARVVEVVVTSVVVVAVVSVGVVLMVVF